MPTGGRVMVAGGAASRTRPEDPAPAALSLVDLAEQARACQACPLHRDATQTVFGAGIERTGGLMLVGEQPGHEEDLAGAPFVGPAGRLLDQLLEQAGIDRRAVYVTNAVKHFKFVMQGKRRLHQKPKALEIRACKPWLMAEIGRLRPEVILALGATAAGALFGPKVSVVKDRGKPISSPLAPRCFVTFHPSAALRGPRPEDRARLREALLEDLRAAAPERAAVTNGPRPPRGRSGARPLGG